MKTAYELFYSPTSKDSINKGKEDINEYFAVLDMRGAKGKLAKYLFLAQRASDRFEKAAVDPSQSPYTSFFRYKQKQLEYQMKRLTEFCDELNLVQPFFTRRYFKYGMRIKIRNVRALRFRQPKSDEPWRGDVENTDIICDYCQSLVKPHEHATGTLFNWPTAV